MTGENRKEVELLKEKSRRRVKHEFLKKIRKTYDTFSVNGKMVDLPTEKITSLVKRLDN